MECAAADLILGETESGSLFNDSLDSDHNSHQVVEKSTNRGSATVPSSDQEPCNLDDSLNFDDTQLPYSESNAEVAISTPLSCSTVSDGKAGGFVLAKNITVSEESAVKEENEKENALQPNTEVDASDTKKSTSVSSRGRASATEKASRVVPSFGRRKNKSQVSPEAVKRDQKSSDKKTASDSRVPTDHQCNDEESLREDQCVPQTNDTTEQQPQIKPQFGTSSSKVKPAVKKSASSSSRERKNKSKTLPNITSTDGEDKCMATNTTAGGGNDDHTKTETATTAGSDKGIVLPKSEKREKKSADQEQKKQEREEKRREAERKKLEREQKKREAEAKKAERERLKRERQLELEKKKAEREQKKIEQALKKAQRMATKTEQGKASRERINNKDKSKVSNGAKDSHSLELQSEKEEREMERETKQEKVAEGDEGASPSRANVVGVTEPDESASLPITPNPTSHNTATDLEPGSVAEGNGLSSSMDEMEPQKSAAMLPQHAADEGVCDTKNERDKHCDSENEPKRLIEDARLPSTEKQNEAVLRERNTADQSTPSYKKENCGKENIKPMEEATSANDSCSVSVEKLKIVFGKSGKGAKKGSNGAGSSSGTNRDLAKKGMSKKAYTTASVRKQKVSSGDGRIASTSSSTKSKKRVCTREEGGSSDGERERKCSRVSNSVGPVWVQCDRASCQKWRKLRDCSDPLSLPDSWTCSINTGKEHCADNYNTSCKCLQGQYVYKSYYAHNVCMYVCMYVVHALQIQREALAQQKRRHGQRKWETARSLLRPHLSLGPLSGPRWTATLG